MQGVEFLLSIKSELTTVCNYKLCTGKNFIKYWSPHPSGTGPNALRNRVPGPGLKRPEVNKETGQRFTDDPPCQVRAPRRPWDFKFRVIVDRAQSHLIQPQGSSHGRPGWQNLSNPGLGRRGHPDHSSHRLRARLHFVMAAELRSTPSVRVSRASSPVQVTF